MKKIVFSLFLVTSVSAFSQTQITITSNDLPVVGTSFINVGDLNMIGINVGIAGTNQIYDLSNLGNTSEDTLKYMLPSQTIYASSFVSSNLSSSTTTLLDTNFTFFSSTSSLLSVNGMTAASPVGGNKVIAVASDPLTQLKLPVAYLDSFADVSDLLTSSIYINQGLPTGTIPFADTAYIDSAHAIINISRVSKIDGWGTVTTPYGTYNVLRQTVYDVTMFTPEFLVYAGFLGATPTSIGYITIPGTEVIDTTTTYFYLSNSTSNRPMILAEIAQNAQGVTTSAKYAKDFFPLALNELNTSAFDLYPNPATNELILKSDSKIDVAEISTLEGKKVKTIKLNALYNTINLSDLEKGTYFLTVEIKGVKSSKSFVKL